MALESERQVFFLKESSALALSAFLNSVKEEINPYIDSLRPEMYDAAVSLISKCRERGGRLHVTGIGKPGHVATYIASLISSTGTPCYFLHGTEAVHGSCGQLVADDVVIVISNSGETAEMKSTVRAIKNNHCSIIGVSGNGNSWLAKESDIHLLAGVGNEGGPLNRAPRNSVLAETLTLQALSVALQSECGQDPVSYIRCHPGGSLGSLRESEK